MKDRLLQSNPVLEVTLEAAALDLDIESYQQHSHFPAEGMGAAGPPGHGCAERIMYAGNTGSRHLGRSFALHSQGNPSWLPSHRSGCLLLNSLGPPGRFWSRSGVGRGKSVGATQFAKPQADTSAALTTERDICGCVFWCCGVL